MEIRVARLLGENDQVDLAGVQLQGGVGAGHDFLAVLLLDVLTDRKHPHIGENGLRSENFDAFVASSSRAMRTTSTRSLGRMNPPAEESPLLSILTATARRWRT